MGDNSSKNNSIDFCLVIVELFAIAVLSDLVRRAFVCVLNAVATEFDDELSAGVEVTNEFFEFTDPLIRLRFAFSVVADRFSLFLLALKEARENVLEFSLLNEFLILDRFAGSVGLIIGRNVDFGVAKLLLVIGQVDTFAVFPLVEFFGNVWAV